MKENVLFKRFLGGVALVAAAAVAIGLSAGTASAAGDRTWDGNVQGFVGVNKLNGSWNFSLYGPLTNTKMKLDLSTNVPVVGGTFDLNRKDKVGENWAVNPFMGIYYFSNSASDSEAARITGTTVATNSYKATLSMLEADLGIKKLFDQGGDDLIPTIGVGFTVINASYSLETTSTTVTNNVLTFKNVAKDKDDGFFYGAFGSAGLIFRPFSMLDIGADVKYTYTMQGLKDKYRVNGWTGGLTLGYHF